MYRATLSRCTRNKNMYAKQHFTHCSHLYVDSPITQSAHVPLCMDQVVTTTCASWNVVIDFVFEKLSSNFCSYVHNTTFKWKKKCEFASINKETAWNMQLGE